VCFQAEPIHTAALRALPPKPRGQKRPERHTGYKIVSANRRNVDRNQGTTEYPVGKWVAAQEVEDTFARQPAHLKRKTTTMRAGIYVRRTYPSYVQTGHRVIKVEFEPQDVLGANYNVVCVTRVKVVS
jgi:hypothetical protein